MVISTDTSTSFSPTSGKFDAFIRDQLILANPILESRIKAASRISLRGIAVVSGMGARVPFIRVNLAYRSDPFGIVLAINSAVSFGSVVSWCFLNMIHDKLRPLSEQEKRLLESQQSMRKCRLLFRVTRIGIEALIGMIAQVPLAYMAYAYNSKNVYYPTLVLVVDSAYPIYSLDLTAEEISGKKRLNQLERHLANIKQKFINKLEGARANLASLPKEDKISLLDELEGIKELSHCPNPSKKYLGIVFRHSLTPKPTTNRIIKTGRVVPLMGGTVLGVSQLIFAWMLSYQAAKIFFDNDPICIGWAVFVVLCNLYLTFFVMLGTSMNLYDVGIKCLRRAPPKTLVGSLYPKIQITLRIASAAVSLLSFSGPLKIAQDYFSGNFGIFMQVTSVIASLFIAGTAMFSLADDIIAEGGIRFGSREHRLLIKLDRNLQRLILLIKKSSFIEFLNLLDLIPRTKYQSWLNKLNMTQADISHYLNSLRETRGEKRSLLSGNESSLPS